MSDPTLSDDDFKHKMAWVWTTLPVMIPSKISNSDEISNSGEFDLVKVVFVLVHGTKDSSRDDP